MFKRYKVRALVSFATLLIGCRLAFGAGYFNKINNLTPGEISIVAAGAVSEGFQASRQTYQDLVDCGFNIGTGTGSVDYFRRQFELIGDLNFKYIISNGYLYSDARKSLISALSDSPYLAAWNFKDEPLYKALPELKAQYDALRKDDPDKLLYMNLVGIVNPDFAGPCKTFGEYLDLIQATFAPELWSYDFYPIITRGGKTICETDAFYYALESYREISRKTSRPFWAFCESMAYTAKSYSRPAATENYLRYEAFNALAYGVQGIVYWTYGMRKSNDFETYLSSLVDFNGKKSKAWYAAQKVNREIKRFNRVFYGCNVVDVKHLGKNLYKGTRRLSGAIGPVKMLRCGDSGVVVSYIENNGDRYVVVVNRDVFAKTKVAMELNANKNLKDITSSRMPVYNWRQDITFTLEKGGYKIFKEM